MIGVLAAIGAMTVLSFVIMLFFFAVVQYDDWTGKRKRDRAWKSLRERLISGARYCSTCMDWDTPEDAVRMDEGAVLVPMICQKCIHKLADVTL